MLLLAISLPLLTEFIIDKVLEKIKGQIRGESETVLSDLLNLLLQLRPLTLGTNDFTELDNKHNIRRMIQDEM